MSEIIDKAKKEIAWLNNFGDDYSIDSDVVEDLISYTESLEKENPQLIKDGQARIDEVENKLLDTIKSKSLLERRLEGAVEGAVISDGSRIGVRIIANSLDGTSKLQEIYREKGDFKVLIVKAE